MRFYSDKEMKNLRLVFEGKVLRWQQVSIKKMFGCPCYQANGKLFAFLVTNGIVITQPAPADLEKLAHKLRMSPFRAGKKLVPKWTKLSIKNKNDLSRIMPLVRSSYELALRKTQLSS